MPSICVCLAENPILSVFAFAPGERVNIHVAFESEMVPGRYRLQVLDHKQNSRLNRYGKGLSDIVVNNWPIPTTIRDDHLGIWQVKVDSFENVREIRKVDEESEKSLSFTQIFFVEKSKRTEYPLLGGDMIYQLPELTPIVEGELEMIQEPVEEVITVKEDQELRVPLVEIQREVSVIAVRGIGQTYTDRLAKIGVFTVSDLWNFKDRIYLAEVMRVSDKRLEKMFQDAEILLSEKAEEISREEVAEEIEVVPDDLGSVRGLNSRRIRGLNCIGIKSKTDLLDFEDVNLLKKTLKVSTEELSEILAPIGRIIEPDSVIKPIPVPPLEQPVIVLKGIGKVTAGKLNSVGIRTVEDLLESSYENLNNITTRRTYQKWMQIVSNYTGVKLTDELAQEAKAEIPNELLTLPGIGPKTSEKLESLNIHKIQDLINFEETAQLRKTLRMSESRFISFMKKLKSEFSLK